MLILMLCIITYDMAGGTCDTTADRLGHRYHQPRQVCRGTVGQFSSDSRRASGLRTVSASVHIKSHGLYFMRMMSCWRTPPGKCFNGKHGLCLNIKKTEYLVITRTSVRIQIISQPLLKAYAFRYLGFFLQSDGSIFDDARARTNAT